MSDSVRPHRRQPTRLPHPWDSPGKNTGVGSHFLLQCMKVKSESEIARLCPTLSDPMDCSLPGSSAHGIFQARVLEWVAIAFSVFLHTCLYTQVLGDLHHLLARRPISILWPFSDKGPSTRKLICPKSVVLSKVWCHSQKALNKVTFLHSKDTTIYNKERRVQWFITEKIH